jgi:hypothetical protein
MAAYNELVLLNPTFQLYFTKTPPDLAIGIPNQNAHFGQALY